jgi:hypothetical protein
MLPVGLVALCERRTLSAEPLLGPADARQRIVNLMPSLIPTRAR